MANTLTIFKRSPRGFVHRHNGLAATDYSISDFEVSIGADTAGGAVKFRIVETDGSTRFPYAITDITVIDLTGAGTPETFTTAAQLEDRLRQLNYTPYVTEDGTATTIVAGAGVNITGTGAAFDPYVVEATAVNARAYLELRIIEKGIYDGIPNSGGSSFPVDLQKGDFVAGRKDIDTYWDRAMYLGDDPDDRENCYEELSGGGLSIIPAAGEEFEEEFDSEFGA